jgi:hypothetical protein
MIELHTKLASCLSILGNKIDISIDLFIIKMVMRTIYPLDINDLRAFVKLFDVSTISSIELKLYNGTTTRFQEFSDLGVTLTQTNFELTGKNLATIEKALERVDYNQIQSASVRLMPSYNTCFLNMLSREVTFSGFDTIPLTKIQAFVKEHSLDKVTLRG